MPLNTRNYYFFKSHKESKINESLIFFDEDCRHHSNEWVQITSPI